MPKSPQEIINQLNSLRPTPKNTEKDGNDTEPQIRKDARRKIYAFVGEFGFRGDHDTLKQLLNEYGRIFAATDKESK